MRAPKGPYDTKRREDMMKEKEVLTGGISREVENRVGYRVERGRERSIMEDRGGKGGLLQGGCHGWSWTSRGQAGPLFSSVLGATGALCWDHLVSSKGQAMLQHLPGPSRYWTQVHQGKNGMRGGLGAGLGARLQWGRDAQSTFLGGSGEGKQCPWYQTPPAQEGKRVQVYR